jgi:hypothetical protein
MVANFERKILRKIFGPMQVKEWRIRNNEQIYRLHDDVELSIFLCLKRLVSWPHRLDDSHIPKM